MPLPIFSHLSFLLLHWILCYLFQLSRLYGHPSFEEASQGVHMLPTSSSSPSSLISHLLSNSVILFYSTRFPKLFCFILWSLALPFYSLTTFSSNFSSSLPSLPLCAPFPSTHQSLALASPLRTYGMMDRRASGASKAKGHLPGALRCRGALGPAMQPRPHTSVSRQSHTTCAQQHYYRIGYLTLAPHTLISLSHWVQGLLFLMMQRDKLMCKRQRNGKTESEKLTTSEYMQVTFLKWVRNKK